MGEKKKNQTGGEGKVPEDRKSGVFINEINRWNWQS